MGEICIPIPKFKENQIAEVTVTVGGVKKEFHFKVESFQWQTEPVLAGEHPSLEETERRISSLKQSIESYESGWELVQIFTPPSDSKFIQVLFRKKNS